MHVKDVGMELPRRKGTMAVAAVFLFFTPHFPQIAVATFTSEVDPQPLTASKADTLTKPLFPVVYLILNLLASCNTVICIMEITCYYCFISHSLPLFSKQFLTSSVKKSPSHQTSFQIQLSFPFCVLFVAELSSSAAAFLLSLSPSKLLLSASLG